VRSARGAVTYRAERVRNYRDYLEVSEELGYINWLVQLNRGVFMAPWGKSENWTLSVQHSEADVRRYVDNFQQMADAIV
jgi:glutamate-1-semialdehyde 2,1-aminomutase